MSATPTPPPPAQRPSARGYLVAAVMTAVAVAIVAVVGGIIARALVGYSITPLDAAGPATVTVGDRGVAIWMEPETGSGSCTSVDEETRQPSITSGTADTVTVTDGGRTWTRIGIVEGEPGSRHTVTCTGADGTERFGFADNPRIARYVVIGVSAGAVVGLLVIGAFVIALVTGLRRSKVRPAR